MDRLCRLARAFRDCTTLGGTLRTVIVGIKGSFASTMLAHSRADQLGMQPTAARVIMSAAAADAQRWAALDEGKTILAIKRFREATGIGLKEAKSRGVQPPLNDRRPNDDQPQGDKGQSGHGVA